MMIFDYLPSPSGAGKWFDLIKILKIIWLLGKQQKRRPQPKKVGPENLYQN